MRDFLEWPPILCLALAVSQAVALPARYRMLSSNELAAVLTTAAALIAIANLARLRRHASLARIFTGALLVLLGFLTVRSLLTLVSLLFTSGTSARGWSLLQSALTVWTNNILTFALCYWFFDRGGAAARASTEPGPPEWMFPEMAAPQLTRPDWQPRFPEYLFLALTTATAFSPTDTLPLSSRSRALMGLEALISLVTVALVAARAVNILS